MPISRILPPEDAAGTPRPTVFHITEAIEVYDGALALAVDHLLNHIKTLVALAYVPGGADLRTALRRHPHLRRVSRSAPLLHDGRSPERVLLSECERLLESVLEIARLSADPESAQEAQDELAVLRAEIPFLDFRYDNDPYPSDQDREGNPE